MAVVGCGSVGSLAGWMLASAGIHSQILVDRQVIERENVRRHLAGRSSLGQSKTAFLRGFLEDHFPSSRSSRRAGNAPVQAPFEAHDLCVMAGPARLLRLIRRADVVLVCLDHEPARHLVSILAREAGRPAVFAGVYGGGWGCEVILDGHLGRRRTACYGCASASLGRLGVPTEAEAHGDYRPARDPRGERLDAGNAWRTADLTHIAPCAALAAAAVLDVAGLNPGRIFDRNRPECSALRIRLAAIAPGMPDLVTGTAAGFPVAAELVPVHRRRDCLVCGRGRRTPSKGGRRQSVVGPKCGSRGEGHPRSEMQP